MSLREEQCKKVCRILDNALANRPTERDSLIVATRKAFDAMQTTEPKRGKWVLVCDNNGMHFICDKCGAWRYYQEQNFCGECGADMREVTT